MDEDKKSFWDTVKDSFKPTAARADENIAKRRAETGDQYAKDRAQGADYMKKKLVKGFLNK